MRTNYSVSIDNEDARAFLKRGISLDEAYAVGENVSNILQSVYRAIVDDPPPPPRMEEPLDLGAVVIGSNGIRYTRAFTSGDAWVPNTRPSRVDHWDDIPDPQSYRP